MSLFTSQRSVPLTENEKIMILNAHKYFSEENSSSKKRQKFTLRKRVAEVLGVSESTVGRVIHLWYLFALDHIIKDANNARTPPRHMLRATIGEWAPHSYKYVFYVPLVLYRRNGLDEPDRHHEGGCPVVE